MSDDPEVNSVAVPDYVPTSLTLPTPRSNCPKCSADLLFLVKEYHIYGVFGSTPCGETYSIPELKSLGEHLCVTCDRCNYFWSERTYEDGA